MMTSGAKLFICQFMFRTRNTEQPPATTTLQYKLCRSKLTYKRNFDRKKPRFMMDMVGTFSEI